MELFTKEFHCSKDININYSPSISIYYNREIYTLYTYVPHPRTNRQKYEKFFLHWNKKHSKTGSFQPPLMWKKCLFLIRQLHFFAPTLNKLNLENSSPGLLKSEWVHENHFSGKWGYFLKTVLVRNDFLQGSDNFFKG